MPLVFAAVFLNPTGLSTDIIKMYWEEKKKGSVWFIWAGKRSIREL